MVVRWTDFPERVETLGDLFNIFKTFHHDLTAGTIDGESCSKENDQSA